MHNMKYNMNYNTTYSAMAKREDKRMFESSVYSYLCTTSISALHLFLYRSYLRALCPILAFAMPQ